MREIFKSKKSLLCILVALVMLIGIAAPACKKKPKEPGEYTVSFIVGSEAEAAGISAPESQKVKKDGNVVQPTLAAWDGHTLIGWYNGAAMWDFAVDTVKSDLTLKAEWKTEVSSEIAINYEKNLTWGQKDHLYIHYLRGAHSAAEQGTVNSALAPDYSTQIDSAVYGDWGLWSWEYFPTSGEGRAFYPMKIDESGAVYDIDLTATYNDAGWNEATLNNKGLEINFKEALRLGIQLYSQDSRINGTGFWVNDGGDVYIELAKAKREKGDYHWFVRQGEVGSGTPKFADATVNDPYAGLEPGSATTKYDVISSASRCGGLGG